MTIRPQSWGALLGALLGIAWLIWRWEFLWVAVPIALGYLLGRVLESREEAVQKVKELFRVLFR